MNYEEEINISNTKLARVIMDFDTVDILRLENSKDILLFLQFLFNKPEYLNEKTNSSKVHKLFIRIVSNSQYDSLKEFIVSKIVQDNFNSFSVIEKVYYSIHNHDFSKDQLIIFYIIRLLTYNNNTTNLKKFKENSLKYFKKNDFTKASNEDFNITYNILIWYVLANKGLLDANDLESIIPVLIKSGEFPLARQEKELFFNKYYKLFFAKLLSLPASEKSQYNIRFIIKDELESAFFLQTKSSILFNDPVKLLKLLDFYLLLIQICPFGFCSDIFKTVIFLNFLDENILLLIKAYFENADSVSKEYLKNITISFLSIFVNLCVDDSVAKIIIEKYLELILRLLNMSINSDDDIKALSTLVLVKCWNTYKKLASAGKSKIEEVKIQEINQDENLESTGIPVVALNDLFSALEDIFNKPSIDEGDNISTSDKCCIEGLAFLSLNISFRKLIRSDQKMISKLNSVYSKETKKLLDMSSVDVNEGELSNEVIYGILTIFANILTFNTSLTNEEKSIDYLKKYSSNSIVSRNDDENLGDESLSNNDDNDEIAKFSKNISKWTIFSSLTNKIFVKLTNNIQDLIIRIIYNVSLEKNNRVQLVKMGCLNILLEYLMKDDQVYVKNKKNFNEVGSYTYNNFFRLFAIRALAKILISNNPNLIFNKYSSSVPVPFLAEFLISEGIQNNDSRSRFIAGLTKPLDILESLLSLTNLASMRDFKMKEIIFKKTWSSIEILILDNNEMISKACLELISNLVYYPECANMLFNPDNKKSRDRLVILIKLMNSQNIDLQIAATTILVNGSEYELIADSLYKNEELFHKIIKILNNVEIYYFKKDEEEDESKVSDLLLRIFYLIYNIVRTDDDNGSKLNMKISVINNYSIETDGTLTLKTGINKCLNFIKDEETMALVIDISKRLHYI